MAMAAGPMATAGSAVLQSYIERRRAAKAPTKPSAKTTINVGPDVVSAPQDVAPDMAAMLPTPGPAAQARTNVSNMFAGATATTYTTIGALVAVIILFLLSIQPVD